MRITSLIFVALWAFVTAQAQIVIVPREKLEAMNYPKVTAASLAMKFQTTNIKADPMGEDDGIKTFVYPFTNVGEDTLKIRRMVSGCSCMTAVCQKMALAPGDSTAIVVKYNPKGHPGRFERKVMVYAGQDEDPTVILRLNVEVDRGGDLSGLYPVAMGNIRLRRNEVSFHSGSREVQRCPFVNVSGKELALTWDKFLLPACLSLRTEPAVLQPGQEGEIVITYEPEQGGQRPKMPLIFKGLGLPPMQSSIMVNIIE